MPSGGARAGAGAPRLPDAVKQARGTYRADRSNPNPVRLPVARVPEPPEGLNNREAEWWRALAVGVNAVGVYTEADALAFRMMARAFALLEGAQDGTVLEVGRDENGEPTTKLVSVSNITSLLRVVSGLLTRFGLDPSSRDKLIAAPSSTPAEPVADPDDFSGGVQ